MRRRPAPRLHPKLAEIYRNKVANLTEALNAPDARTEAAEILRDLIDEIRLVPENGRLEIELAGDLAAILALTSDSKKPAVVGGRLKQVRWLRGHATVLICSCRHKSCAEGRRSHRE